MIMQRFVLLCLIMCAATVEAVETVKPDTRITRLKDLRIETDLMRARFVIGSNPLHRELADHVAAALRPKLERETEIVADTAVVDKLPGKDPLIVLGNLADNLVVRKLYLEWHCMVDRAFPGEGGYIIQTIHNPWGTGQNILLMGASDDDGLRRAAARLAELVPKGGKLGRIYEVRPSEVLKKLCDGKSKHTNFLTMYYLITGEDRFAAQYREAMLKRAKAGIVNHLYVPALAIPWDLMEEHPAFSDAERLQITNYLLTQLSSKEGINSLPDSFRPHHNHGTRPALGCFFLARYFRSHYRLPEASDYLKRLRGFFAKQADWSKPYCDSSLHQWVTLDNKATYAFASGEMEFFESGAARQAAERALRSTNNVGHLPIIGDAGYRAGADNFLAKAAFYYDEPRFLWPAERRGPVGLRAAADDLGRGFAVHERAATPEDIVGVSVVPHDKGFWRGWRQRPNQNFPRPDVHFSRAFDKIIFRSGLDPRDDFLILDGVVNDSHDYDDVNVIHEYSRNGRMYITTCDEMFAPNMAGHNGVNIVRDGLSAPPPRCAERLHAAWPGPLMISQTRVNDFAGADWTRSVVFLPNAYFVVLDRMTARAGGTFTLTGHWRILGDATLTNQILTARQWNMRAPKKDANPTFFHVQATGARVVCKSLSYRRSLAARYYPYAPIRLQVLAQSKAVQLDEGESAFLCAVGHETGGEAEKLYHMHEVAPGVVRVTDGRRAAYVGAAGQPVKVGVVEIDADLFYLDDTVLCVAGGRRAMVDGKKVLESAQPVTRSIKLIASDVLKKQLASAVNDVRAGPAAAEKPLPALRRVWQVDAGGEIRTLRTENLSETLGVVAVPSRLGRRADKGKVMFLDAAGKTIREIDVDAAVNDITVADLDGDGQLEFLIGREDRKLCCLDAAGKERFVFEPALQGSANSWVTFNKNSIQRVWVADHGRGLKTIVVSTGDQRVHGLSPDGKPQWMFWAYAGIFTTYGLCDADGDGIREIVGGNGQLSAFGELWFLKARNKNTHYKLASVDGWGATLSTLDVGDLDGDGRDEVVAGTSRSSLAAIDPRTTKVLWRRNLGHNVKGVRILHGPDGKPLVVAGSLSEFVSAFDGSGRKRWATPVGAPVAFVDVLRGRKGQAIAAVCAGGEVVILTLKGEITHRSRIGADPVAVAVPERRKGLLCVATVDGKVTALALPER